MTDSQRKALEKIDHPSHIIRAGMMNGHYSTALWADEGGYGGHGSIHLNTFLAVLKRGWLKELRRFPGTFGDTIIFEISESGRDELRLLYLNRPKLNEWRDVLDAIREHTRAMSELERIKSEA